MKEELGLAHFEGRSWNGFHHHVAMVFLAYGFLELERYRMMTTPRSRVRRPKKNSDDMDHSALCPACASELAAATGAHALPAVPGNPRKPLTDVTE